MIATGLPKPVAYGAAARSRLAVAYLFSSAALLVPCFWLPRIQAGDLASHVYNAWLFHLVKNGQAPGLVIRPQFTNVLFDRLLAWLLPAVGAGAAERIACAAAVLIFFWGAFAFVCVVTESRPWRVLPAIAMLSYGDVFAMGFMNFYLSLGSSLWVLALLWRPSWPRAAAALALVPIALMAHSLPVAWCVGAFVYSQAAFRLKPWTRFWLLGASIAALVPVRLFVMARYSTVSSWVQAFFTTGADQVWVFGTAFLILAFLLAAIWLLPVFRIFHEQTVGKLAGSIPAQLLILTAAGIAIVPAVILLPGYKTALGFIPDRMSLCAAICVCAVAASVPWGKLETAALSALALAFFAFLYVDQRAIDSLESRIRAAVLRLPRGSRVVSAVVPDQSRVFALVHLIDRACIGHCFSYGNYEPATAQFRIRAVSPGPVVVAEPEDSFKIRTGEYNVRAADGPLYEITANEDGSRIGTHELKSGERTRSYTVHVLPF